MNLSCTGSFIISSIFSSSRSTRPEVFCKKGVLRIFTKFTGKHLCQGPATLLKKRLWHRSFPVNFAKFLRAPFSWNTSAGCFYSSTNYIKNQIPVQVFSCEFCENFQNSFHFRGTFFVNQPKIHGNTYCFCVLKEILWKILNARRQFAKSSK